MLVMLSERVTLLRGLDWNNQPGMLLMFVPIVTLLSKQL
jgi:hypothetical protein